jgi:hypothetical protein
MKLLEEEEEERKQCRAEMEMSCFCQDTEPGEKRVQRRLSKFVCFYHRQQEHRREAESTAASKWTVSGNTERGILH